MRKSKLSCDKEELFFCLLSGENPTLPYAEIAAILESEKYPMETIFKLPRVIEFRSTTHGVQAIAKRAAYTRLCCREILTCKDEEAQILDKIKNSELKHFIEYGETFKVELVKLEPRISIDTKKMREKIGQIILDSIPGIKVNLIQSDKTFLGIIIGEYFLFGSIIGRRDIKLTLRRPHLRPFFHPSAMSTKLARCMINLSRARPGSFFLDAFCGTGSNLIEASLMGSIVLGSDVDIEMVRGAFQNLCFSGVKEFHLCVANAKALPFKYFDSCASDPPYGRGSSTRGEDAVEVVKGFLENIFKVLASGNHICLAFPKEGTIKEIGKSIGYDIRESHLVREHKSLTREVIVLRKP